MTFFSALLFIQFEEFDKLIYLDADMLLFQNIDELFDSPPGTVSGVMDCFCEGEAPGALHPTTLACP